MKRLTLLGIGMLFGHYVQAQHFILPAATERLGPSFSGPLFSSSYLFNDQVDQVSNADFSSVLAGNVIKIAGWSGGGTGGFVFGADDASGAPAMNMAQVTGGRDIQVAILENTMPQLYALTAYYNVSTGAYECQLYTLAASTATPVYSKTLMVSPYNRISMDVRLGGAGGIAFTWSDSVSVYTAFAKLAPGADSLIFSPSLANPAIRITGGSSHKSLPDVAFASSNTIPGTADSIYYTYYDDSASQVELVKVSLNQLNSATSNTLILRVRDYNSVSGPMAVELDAPASSVGNDCWGYTYADGYVKVRHKARLFGPVTVTINNGSLVKGPAAMSVTGADYHPVIAYNLSPDFYSVGWTTTRATNPYAYPHGTAMVHVQMNNNGSRDSLGTLKDYQLINALPSLTSMYVRPVLAFSTINEDNNHVIYAAHARFNSATSPYADLVHQNHTLAAPGYSAFKLAAATSEQALAVVPNPSSSTFELIGANDPQQAVKLSLTDMTGRNLLEYTGSIQDANAQLKKVSGSLQTGTYVISSDCAGKQQQFKVQKLAQ